MWWILHFFWIYLESIAPANITFSCPTNRWLQKKSSTNKHDVPCLWSSTFFSSSTSHWRLREGDFLNTCGSLCQPHSPSTSPLKNPSWRFQPICHRCAPRIRLVASRAATNFNVLKEGNGSRQTWQGFLGVEKDLWIKWVGINLKIWGISEKVQKGSFV